MKPSPHQTSARKPGLTDRFRSIRLSTKAVVLSVVLVTIIIAAVFVSLSIEIRRETNQLLRDNLDRSAQQVLRIQEDHLQDLLWVSSQVSSNPTLRAAIETYRLETGERDEVDPVLLATVQNELNKIWGGLRHHLLFVTDGHGKVLGANNSAGWQPEPGQSVADLPFIRHALDPQSSVGQRNFGVVRRAGQNFFVGSTPITLQDYVIGTLTLGDRIDDSFLSELRAVFGGQTLVTAGDKLITSTLPEAMARYLDAGATRNLPQPDSALDTSVRIGNEEFVVSSMSLGRDESDQPVTLYLLRSFTAALAEPNRKLMNTLATQAVFAILLAAILAWIAMRTGLRPLQRFVGFMKRVADTGDYSSRFLPDAGDSTRPGDSGSPSSQQVAIRESSKNELDLLVNGFNSMLAEIEQRDSSIKKAHADLQENMRVLHRQEQQLRQLQKMEAIGLLAGGVAHDFNNILMVVSGFSDLALKSLPLEHEARECIEEVKRAAKTASLLTRQLLTFSSKQVSKPRIVDINKLVGDVENILGSVIGETMELKTHLDPRAGSVLIDPAQMEQVLLNLTVNARDAIRSEGEIVITTTLCTQGDAEFSDYSLTDEHPLVKISVRDDGCGMDGETQSHMFEPFFTTKEKGKGTGLGLSTVHGIVRQSAGHVRVESEPGKGTEVLIFLPQVLDEIEEHVPVHTSGSSPGSGTVLVVEDEPDVRKVVCRILKVHGYNVIETSGPQEALAVMEQSGKHVDILLTDVIMPVMNGKELNEKVLEIKPEIKTLYISGYADGVIDDTGILLDGLNFLQKPFTPETLLAKLHRILNEDL